ncbi:MAG: hypothetical protein M1818_001082 [Claussenomyces sp. TS43310]|nr:MAG: hypothetical protein M1818_001082 [Claussenomyces sp. TS43310]
MPYQRQHEYTVLGQSPSTTNEKYFDRQPRTLRLVFGAALLTITTSALTVFLLKIFSPSSHHVSTHTCGNSSDLVPNPIAEQATLLPERLKCGNSVEEALSLGCVFDPLSIAWLPSYCPRDEANAFVEAAGNGTQWRYWMDQDGTQELQSTYELARIGPKVIYWTTVREHMNHCFYMLLRVHRAMERARNGDMRVDATAKSYHHTKHCLMTLYNMASSADNEKIGATGEVAFGSC